MLARNWNIGFILFDFSPFFPTWVHCLWIPYRQRSSIDLGLFLMVPSQHITLGQRTQSPKCPFLSSLLSVLLVLSVTDLLWRSTGLALLVALMYL